MPPACAAQFAPEDAWRCVMGEYVLPRVATRLVLLNFLYDAYQLGNDLGASSPAGWTAAQAAYAEDFRAMQAATGAAVAAAGSAVHAPACYKHCYTEDDAWASIVVGGPAEVSVARTQTAAR